MYVCICICIHVNVCHVYIACHLQRLAAATKWRSLPLDHPSQLGPLLDIPSPSGPHVRQPRFPPRIVRHQSEESVKTERSLKEKMCFWWKNRDFEPKGVDLNHTRGVTMGRGREWKLPERNDFRNHSRKYFRELWKVSMCLRVGFLLKTESGYLRDAEVT